jgi:hypothetical protein
VEHAARPGDQPTGVPEASRACPPDSAFVFNVVWTGSVFPFLQYFVASQIAQSDARFRFVANGCPPDQVALMEHFARVHPQVVEVLDVSTDMVAHGVALDRVRAQRDDGAYFSLIDPDIKAKGPFVGEFAAILAGGASVATSGTEIWSDSNVIPPDHVGVPGECFYDRNGFVFGSPHLAVYDRAVLDETAERWGVGLGSAGPELAEPAARRLEEMGHHYIAYDTGKIVNALLQSDGHELVHRDLPQLVHIGGLSHYLAPPGGYITLDDGEVAPDFARWGINDRYHVTKFTALTLRELSEGEPVPAIPQGVDAAMARKLEVVLHELSDLFLTYADR